MKKAYKGLGVFVLYRKMSPRRYTIVQAYDQDQARDIAARSNPGTYKKDFLDKNKTVCRRQRRRPGLVHKGG